ncbi:hypothetical protein SUGI_0003320 [Cryptomeria japonica]|nr:hypothetical protein SUGI_0003320 [Cryptomeria japonica]
MRRQRRNWSNIQEVQNYCKARIGFDREKSIRMIRATVYILLRIEGASCALAASGFFFSLFRVSDLSRLFEDDEGFVL